MITILISKVFLYFALGIKIYNYLSLKNWSLLIKYNFLRLRFIDYFLIYFSIVFIIKIIINFIILNVFEWNNIFDVEIISYMTDNNTNTNTNTTLPTDKANYTTAADSAIMATALAAGSKLAHSQPSITGKVATLAGSVALGSTAIAFKNISSNLTSNIGKKSKFTFDTETIAKMLNIHLSGNDLYDLLQFIHYVNKLSLIFVFFAIYYFLISLINIKKIEKFLDDRINKTWLLNYLKRVFNYTKKTSIYFKVIFLILLLIASYLSYYYTGFILLNYEEICNKYIK